jgi:hypothetical protein
MCTLPSKIFSTRTVFIQHSLPRSSAVTKPNYAKWTLDDPRVNFAI